ncbi:hypothetical protein CFC21_078183 [Triticum aestivum]|uniref:carboxypeptidase D n=2 Tax=Triticum aestivum TaxID=4565 RepID=A0A9R1HX32_WHEAT|nr:serine carboxypeptidase-like 18 isoform X2 [Triticum aestivum]KAF7073146.1 hypothetical protein CFC21_078183 [Triticum aestivum]
MDKASLVLLSLVVPLVLLLLPLSRPASVVTHLPGFHGRLPFRLETGYVGVDEETGAELFYYFVESERSPDTDPVILWMTGGPFCSGMVFFEVGPMKFVLAPYNGSLPQLAYNPYSWSKTTSIILLDSPVGTGFSYARDVEGYHDIGDFSFSMHVLIFLNKWFTDHPHYQSNPFFVGGSSYAGKMSPIIAQHISQEIELGKQPKINLKGYVVGNPVTGSDYDDNFRVPYAHGVGIISDQLYEAAIRNCKGSYIRPTDKMCARVLNTFQNGTIGEFVRCKKSIPYTSEVPSSIKYHFNLTSRGYRSLVFSGDHDLVIPFLSTHAWIRSFNFSVVDDWRAWHLDGQVAGFTITYANYMTFVTIKGGGHVSIEHRPKECLAMVQRWLDNEPL